MQKLLITCCLIISGCSYQNKPKQLDPVAVVANRIEIQGLSTIPLRSETSDGLFTTSNSNYIDVARVFPPSFTNSYGDIQATAVEVKGNRAYVVYNTAGDEVGGAVDIIDLTNKSSPVILSTYLSTQYEFSNVLVKDSYLYVSGYQKGVGAILMILSASGDQLEVIDVKKVNGIYATDLSLDGNRLLVITGTEGGITEFDVTISGTAIQNGWTTVQNGLSVTQNTYFKFYMNGQSNTQVSSATFDDYGSLFNGALTPKPDHFRSLVASVSEAPTRIKLKNSILYSLSTATQNFQLIDASQAGKSGLSTGPLSTISTLSVNGTANGFDLDQQKVFLALGEKGVAIASIADILAPQLLGTLSFNTDNGSANNIWHKETASGQKYVFIAYGRQGLRIITEVPKVSVSSKVVKIYARGDTQLLEGAKFQLRINGVVVKTQETTNDYTQYTYTHSSNLTSIDVVEVIYINDNVSIDPLLKRNLFVNYLQVGDKYCYQEKILTKNTQNEFGLFENGDSVMYNKGVCKTKNENIPTCSSNQHLENNLCVDNQKSCSVLNGTGTQTWVGVGSTGTWGACVPQTCTSTHLLLNGLCVPQVCTPNAISSCTEGLGVGIKTCNSNGTSIGLCLINSCTVGNILINGLCLPQVCIPNSIASCSGLNGTGTKTCNSTGLDYGLCPVITCNSGYTMVSGVCTPQLCTPNAVTSCPVLNGLGIKTCDAQGLLYGSCTATTCDANFINVAGVCTPQVCSPNSTISCLGVGGSGTKTCNSTGLAYGSCNISTCNSGFDRVVTAGSTWTYCSEEDQNCLFKGTAQVQYGKNETYIIKSIIDGTPCTNNIFTDPLTGAAKECNVKGTFSCVPRVCAAGTYDNGTSCIFESCAPLSTTLCSENNFAGTKTCNIQGSAYGSCITTTVCMPGFSYSGNSCVPQVCTPNEVSSCSSGNGSGIRTCTADGLSIGQCILSSCNSGFNLAGGACIAQTCAPNSMTSCTISNGTGVKSCNSSGTAYGSCTVGTCNSGYYNNNGVCTSQSCTPNSTQSCTINNFVGTNTCNSTGSGLGGCVSVGTCSTGYYLSNGQCLPQTCTPNLTTSCLVNNGLGTKTCSSNGSAYGSCSTNSCNLGYALVNGSCVSQLCTPNTIQSCTINNFVGINTCSSNGTVWGSCTSTGACSTGYYLSGVACVPQICSPNTSAACSITNGAGLKMCNAQGSSYNSCLPVSCNSGFVLVNGVCEIPCDPITELIKNGSFEIRDASVGLVNGKILSSLTNWDVYNTIPSWYTEAGSGIKVKEGKNSLNAQQGSFMIELDSEPNSSRGSITNITMTQDVLLIAGAYSLKFYYHSRAATGTTSEMKVLIDGIVASTVNILTNQWNLINLPISILSPGIHKVSLKGSGTQDSFGALVDNVSLKRTCN